MGLRSDEPGVYDVLINYSHNGPGGQIQVEFGKQVIQSTVPNTGGWDKYIEGNVGSILISKAGSNLRCKALQVVGESALDLTGITLRPAVGSRAIVAGGTWAFRFPPRDLRHVKFVVQEYRGEAVVSTALKSTATNRVIMFRAKTDVLPIAGPAMTRWK